jgi:hypothetical protein
MSVAGDDPGTGVTPLESDTHPWRSSPGETEFATAGGHKCAVAPDLAPRS